MTTCLICGEYIDEDQWVLTGDDEVFVPVFCSAECEYEYNCNNAEAEWFENAAYGE